MMTDEIKPWRVLRPKGPPTFIKSIMLPRNHNENPHFTLANTLFLSYPLSLHNDHNGSYIGVTVVHSPLRLASRTTIGPNARWPCGSSVNSYRTVSAGRVIIVLHHCIFCSNLLPDTWPLTGRPFRASAIDSLSSMSQECQWFIFKQTNCAKVNCKNGWWIGGCEYVHNIYDTMPK